MSDLPHLTAGIDAGASSVKVVLARSDRGEGATLLGSVVQRIRRRSLEEVVRSAFEAACGEASVAPSALCYVASTGDSDAVPFRTGHFYGMTAHARGACFLDPECRAVVDVGALHARAIKMDARGKVLGHRMTSQCASGSGQFVENIARYLGVTLEDVGALSVSALAPEQVSGICAVLAETDVINMVSRGIGAADILRGIHASIAERLARLLRAAGAEGVVQLTGGPAADAGLVLALREACVAGIRGRGLDLTVRSHPQGILAGAIGAALLGARRFADLIDKGRFDVLGRDALIGTNGGGLA